MTIEAVVLTSNERANLPDCLRSLLWADAIMVFDSGSWDGTQDIARDLGARVVEHPFEDFASQRSAALEAAKGDWVFFVDADERCPPELAAEIRRAVEGAPAGWWVPRDNYLFGRLTRYAGWYPDYQLRLLRRGRARYDPRRPVHETVLLDGEQAWLKHSLVHYNYASVWQFMAKQGRYAHLEAGALGRQGVPRRVRTLLSRPAREFWRRFVQLEGYRMGGHGLLLSVLTAYYSLAAYWLYLRMPEDAAPGR
ncbi:MAG: glycosyltransferase family 2 protein [Anaerolineae bacterium]|nr:glycosyltransferase family 2 protein [Anaerolineae bacterium]